jgi:hypothetical protein
LQQKLISMVPNLGFDPACVGAVFLRWETGCVTLWGATR